MSQADSGVYRSILKHTGSVFDGVAVIDEIKEDTLNREDYKPSKTLEPEIVMVTLGDYGKEIKREPKKNLTFGVTSKNYNDSLSIGVIFPSLNGQYSLPNECAFLFQIKDNKYRTSYYENNSKKKVFKKIENASSKNSISLSTKANEFILSNIPKKKNNAFYGKVSFTTDDFFEESADFKKGFIHKRFRISVVFMSLYTE